MVQSLFISDFGLGLAHFFAKLCSTCRLLGRVQVGLTFGYFGSTQHYLVPNPTIHIVENLQFLPEIENWQ